MSQSELDWVKNTVMPYLGIDRLQIGEDLEHTATYPDIWYQAGRITVTREWARQRPRERKKRLLHEALHHKGLDHMPSIGYYSKPGLDRFSWRVMKMMEAGIPFEKAGVEI